MKNLIIALALLVAPVSACSVTQKAELSQMNVEEQRTWVAQRLSEKKDPLLVEYAQGKSHQALSGLPNGMVADLASRELGKRYNISPVEAYTATKTDRIRVGQKLGTALISWGCGSKPINVSVGRGWYHAQYQCGGSYLYSRDGKTVSSYQT